MSSPWIRRPSVVDGSGILGVVLLLQPGSGRLHWGQPCPGIINGTTLDVPGLMTRFSGECSAYPLLLDVLPELHKLPCFLIELGLHLADLLDLCVLTPRRD